MKYRSALICALSLAAAPALAATLSFSEIDTDGDGRISSEEASAANLGFAAMDVDADGEISMEEFQAAGVSASTSDPASSSSSASAEAAGAGSAAGTGMSSGTTYGGSDSSSSTGTLPGKQSEDPSVGGDGEGDIAGGGIEALDNPKEPPVRAND